MFEYIKPITWCMSFFGLYHVNPLEKRRGVYKVFNCRSYCLFISIILWINLLRYIPVFWIGVKALRPFEVMSFFWFLQGALNATFCFRACSHPDHLQEYQRIWVIFQKGIEDRGMDLLFTKKFITRWTIVWLVFSWTFIVSNTFLYVAGMAGVFPRGELILKTYVDPFPKTVVNYCIYLIVDVFLSAAWIFPFCLIIVCNIALKNIADKLEAHIKEEVESSQHLWPWNGEHTIQSSDAEDQSKTTKHVAETPDVNSWRFHHLRLCDLVSQLDKDFRMIILGFSIVSIPKACYITYRLIHHVTTNYESTFNIINVYWLVFTVFNATCILICAYLLNDALYSPMKYLPRLFGTYNGGMDQLLLQLQLFVLRLKGTGEPMGFTVGGMVVVSKGLLLTMIGVYFTFVFLVLEFEFELLN